MRFLFIHPNFPAQFGRLAAALAQHPEHQIVYLTGREEGEIAGVQKVIFKESRKFSPKTHPYLSNFEEAILKGQGAYRAGVILKEQGFVPDVIYGHSGWGATLYMKELFPQVPLVCYFEWFYHAHGTDAEFGPNEKLNYDAECYIRTKNMAILQDLYTCDAGVSPTYWQHSQFPVEYANKIHVMHDGIDTENCCPRPGATLVLPHINLDLSDAEEVITYVGRGMEPYRGFPQFMESVSMLMKRRPKCHVVVVGADRVAYGGNHPSGKSYKEVLLEQFSFDHTRIHFTGSLPYNLYLQVLQASSVHVYLTRPFVLSWSMLEAMACGCVVVASDTQPVREVINDGVNGLLFDFFSPRQIADRVEEALDDRVRSRAIGLRARATILDRYELTMMLNKQLNFLQYVVRQHKGGQ